MNEAYCKTCETPIVYNKRAGCWISELPLRLMKVTNREAFEINVDAAFYVYEKKFKRPYDKIHQHKPA